MKSFLEVVTVAGTVDSGRRHSILNSDGQPHPVQNILTIVTLVLGLVSFALGMVITQALQALSPAHRQILNETILRDRTVNEAAEILGIPVGTVKSRVYYALRALRVAFDERGVSA